MIVRGDLNRPDYALGYVRNEILAGALVATPDVIRHDQLRVGIDGAPQPEIPLAGFFLFHPLPMLADILPLLVKFQTGAWQVAKLAAHVVRQRFPRLGDNAENGILADREHPADGINRRSFGEHRKD